MTEHQMPMAWNEPGGGGRRGDRDPWNSGGDGPPDLDQVFKKFQEHLGALFGGGGGGNSSNAPGNKSFGMFISLLLISLLLFYGFTGFYTIASYEQGVITRFGKYNRTVNEGLHWAPRLVDLVKKVNTENLTSSRHSGLMLTKDENILLVEIEVHYRIIDAEKYLFTIREPDATLRQAADSALRQVIGESLTDDVLTEKKQQIAVMIKDQLIATLKLYDGGFYIAAVNFKDSRPPEQVKDAFDDVTKSREDKERLKLQADAYYNKVVPEAEGLAKQMILEAEAYRQEMKLAAEGEAKRFNLIFPQYNKAPELTKTRLYIDAIEDVLKRTRKVLVNIDAANNFLYLPLDKLMTAESQVTNEALEQLNAAMANDNGNQDAERLVRGRRRRG